MSIGQRTEAAAIDATSEAKTGAKPGAAAGRADGLLRAPNLSIATVCLSGTLEDKLAAAAAARLPRDRDVRARPHRIALVAPPGPARVRPPWPVHRCLPAVS